jgi:hypothetical protein
MFMIAGMYFDDPAEWAALLEPRLRYLETYDANRPETSKQTRGAAAVYRSADSTGAGPRT